MAGEKSYFRATIIIYLTNLFLGIPGGVGLSVLSRYLEYSFNFLSESLAWGFAFLIMSMHVLMKGISSPVSGYYSDKRGRRFTLLIGGILSLIGGSCLAISTFNLVSLAIIGTLIVGSARGFLMTSFNTIAADIGEKYDRIGQTESYCDGLYVIGVIIGGAFSLFLRDDNFINQLFNIQNYSPFFILCVILFIFAFIFILIFLKDAIPIEELRINQNNQMNYKEIIYHENFKPVFLYAFTVEAAESGYIATAIPILLASFPFFVKPESSALFSTLPFSLGLGLFFLFAGIINDKKGRKYTATLGCILIIIFSILATFFMISLPLIFIIVFLLSGSSSFVRSTIESTWGDVFKADKRGRAYGTFRFFNELGGVIHPLLMFLLNIFFGVPIYFSAILIIIFALSSLIIGHKYFKETLEL